MVIELPLYLVLFKSDLKPNHAYQIIAQGKLKMGYLQGLITASYVKTDEPGALAFLKTDSQMMNWSIRLSQDDELVGQTFPR